MNSLFKKYTVFQIITLFLSIFSRKLFVSKHVRIIRYQFFILGKKYIDFGHNLSAGIRLRPECYSYGEKKLLFGNNIKINNDIHYNVPKKNNQFQQYLYS